MCCNRAVIPMHFQRNHLEKRVNRRLLLTNVCVYFACPKPLLQIASAIKLHHSISALRLLLLTQANVKKQYNIN